MYRRRLFYDVTTGETLRSYAARGALKTDYTAAQEAADCGLKNWRVMEWDAPDDAIEAAFADTDADGNPRTVTATVVDGELQFEYAPIPVEDDPYAIIDALTGEV